MTRRWVSFAVLLAVVTGPLAADTGAPSLEIRGRIVDAPVGVAVELTAMLLAHPQGAPPASTRVARSNADETFLLPVSAAGMWRITARAPGHLALAFDLVPLIGDRTLPATTLPLAKIVYLQIKDPEGQPVVGAAVHVRFSELAPKGPWPLERWRPAEQIAISDETGVVEISLGAGVVVDVAIIAPGFVPLVMNSFTGERRAVRLSHGVERVLKFRSTSGEPQPGTIVQLGHHRWPVALADTNGSAVVTVPRSGALQLDYEGGDRRRPGERLGPGEGAEKPLTVFMPPPATVTGRLVDNESGEGIAGALVWPPGQPQLATRSDRTGQYTAGGLHPSESWFLVAAAGYRSKVFQARPGWGTPTTAPTVGLEPALAIRGLVVSAKGLPLEGAKIRVQTTSPRRSSPMAAPVNDQAISGGDGSFAFRELPARTGYHITATKAGWGSISRTLPHRAPGVLTLETPLVMFRGVPVRGSVVDRAGQGVAEARVELVNPRTVAPEGVARVGATDIEGSYSLSNVPPGRYDLEVDHPAFAAVTLPGVLVPEHAAEIELPPVELTRGLPLTGRVFSAEGEPLEDAEVFLLDVPTPQQRPVSAAAGRPVENVSVENVPATRSDSKGEFRLAHLQEGAPITLEVRRRGFTTRTLPNIEVPGDDGLEIVLQATGALTGRVVQSDGTPLYRAAVSIQALGAGSRPFVYGKTLTDRTGQFAFTEAPAGDLILVVSAVGFQQVHVPVVDLASGEQRAGLEIELSVGGVISGTVLTPDGTSVPGAQVNLVREVPGGSGFYPTYHGAAADGEGRYRLAGLPFGRQILALDHPMYPRIIHRVEISEEPLELDFELRPGAEVVGKVVDADGRPIASALLRLMPMGDEAAKETGSAADGTFRFVGVASGAYLLVGEKEGYAGNTADRPIEVFAGEVVEGLTLHLSAGTTVSGQILGIDPALISRVEVAALHASLGRRLGILHADTRYEIEHLAPGNWFIEARLPGTGRQVRRPLVLGSEQPPQVDLDFGRGKSLTGHVYLDEQPVQGARVRVVGLDIAADSSTLTSPGGRFRLEPLHEGTYQLEISDLTTGLRHRETFDLRQDETMEVRLKSGAIHGVVRDASTAETVPGVLVALFDVAPNGTAGTSGRRVVSSDSTGRFSLIPVSEGEWRLLVQHEGYAAFQRRISVHAEQPIVEVTIELEPSPP